MNRLALFAILAIGCGPKPSPDGQHDKPATAVLPDVPFDDLDHDQRVQFMKERVLPAMKPLFQRHDPKQFVAFDCKTCHGDGAAAGKFEMPNPSLPALDFNDMSKHEPADIEWMKSVVKPTMAKLLRRTEYSPETPDGFGCTTCHPIAAK